MTRFRPPVPVRLTLNLAPMVDVMMCLIIFFLLASRLVDAELRPVNLPYAVAANATDSADTGARVLINIRPGAQPLDAELVVNGWDGQNIVERILPPEELDGFLAARTEQAARARQSVRCVIRADRNIAYRHVERVMRACAGAKISNIVFGANAGPEPQGAP